MLSVPYLELSVVELVAVLEEELVGGAQAGLHTVLHHGAGPWGAGQLLHLHSKGSALTAALFLALTACIQLFALYCIIYKTKHYTSSETEKNS